MRGSPEPLLSIPRSGYCSSSPPESDAGNRSAIAVECPQGFRSVQNHQRTPVLVFIKASEQRTGSTERLSDPADISAVSRDLGRISELDQQSLFGNGWFGFLSGRHANLANLSV